MLPGLTELLLAAHLTVAHQPQPAQVQASAASAGACADAAALEPVIAGLDECLCSDFCCGPDSCQCYGSCKPGSR